MKVEINNINKPETKYPWVGQLESDKEETIVLFTTQNEGVCLYSTDSINTSTIDARVSYTWQESRFIPCSITLDSTTKGSTNENI